MVKNTQPTTVVCKIKFNLADDRDRKVLQLLKAQKTPLMRKALIVKGVLSLYESYLEKEKASKDFNEALVKAIDRLGDRLESFVSAQEPSKFSGNVPVSLPPEQGSVIRPTSADFVSFTPESSPDVGTSLAGSVSSLLSAIKSSATI